MSMSTQEAFDYLNKLKGNDNTAAEVETPSVETSKAEEVNVDSPVSSASNDGDQKVEEVKGSDEPKTDDTNDKKEEVKSETPVEDKVNKEVKEETDKKEHSQQEKRELSHEEKRDYAFIKTKNKNKELKKQVAERDKRIKELEDTLKKYEPLTSNDFKNADGSVNIDGYTNWKLKERDIQHEIKDLQAQNSQDQLAYDLEQDRILTERCFQGKDLEDYNKLIQSNGQVFAQVCHEHELESLPEKDKNANPMFTTLDTFAEYPIVLRELMTNPHRWLNTIYRSNDVNAIKYNTARVANEILDMYHKGTLNPKKEEVKPEVKEETKKAIPVIGKQITNNNTSIPVVKDSNYWNNYLRLKPKG